MDTVLHRGITGLMLRQPSSACKLECLNRRQRKKLRVGELQELVFEVLIRFHQPMTGAGLDAFWDDFIDLIESCRLGAGGLGGRLPLLETDGVISTLNQGSPAEDDWLAVQDWLRKRVEVLAVEVGEFADGWYGWENTP